MRFIRKRKSEEDNDYSWDNNEENEKSHSMWSSKVKKLLKKVGLC